MPTGGCAGQHPPPLCPPAPTECASSSQERSSWALLGEGHPDARLSHVVHLLPGSALTAPGLGTRVRPPWGIHSPGGTSESATCPHRGLSGQAYLAQSSRGTKPDQTKPTKQNVGICVTPVRVVILTGQPHSWSRCLILSVLRGRAGAGWLLHKNNVDAFPWLTSRNVIFILSYVCRPLDPHPSAQITYQKISCSEMQPSPVH